MRSRFVPRSGGAHFWNVTILPKVDPGPQMPRASVQTSELHNLAVIDKKGWRAHPGSGCDMQRLGTSAPMRVAGASSESNESGRTFWISSFEPDGIPKYAIRAR